MHYLQKLQHLIDKINIQENIQYLLELIYYINPYQHHEYTALPIMHVYEPNEFIRTNYIITHAILMST